MKMSSRTWIVAAINLSLFASILGGFVTGQTRTLSDLDKAIKDGLDLLPRREWAKARTMFEEALEIVEKDSVSSAYLIRRLSLPDEDAEQIPRSQDEAAIMGYRHVMGTKQALLEFLAFTSQLEGNKTEADRYFNDVYRMQGPLWGTSWRIFIPQIQATFHLATPVEKSENYGRYLFMSGQLLWDSGEKMGQRIMLESQSLLPKDADVAARLASAYMVLQDPEKAKPQAELSLSIKPKQERVLIDLATAEWVLGDFDSSAKHAIAAAAIDPKLPGPHMMLALIALQKGEVDKAAQKIEESVELSNRHPYYLTIQAAVAEARGDSSTADKLVREAWEGKPPKSDQFEKWFTKHRPLALIRTILGRQK